MNINCGELQNDMKETLYPQSICFFIDTLTLLSFACAGVNYLMDKSHREGQQQLDCFPRRSHTKTKPSSTQLELPCMISYQIKEEKKKHKNFVELGKTAFSPVFTAPPDPTHSQKESKAQVSVSGRNQHVAGIGERYLQN